MRTSVPPGSGAGKALGASAESAARATASSVVTTAASPAQGRNLYGGLGVRYDFGG
jgi:hypothetical protein